MMKHFLFQRGRRKLTAFFTSIAVYLFLMLSVIVFLRPCNISLESFSISLATGIMVISYGFYASNAFVHAKSGNELLSEKNTREDKENQ